MKLTIVKVDTNMTTHQNFAYKPAITGEKVMLRPFQLKDIQTMQTILSDYEVRKLTGSACSEEEAYMADSEEEVEKIAQWYRTRNEQKDRLDLAVVQKETNQVIGEVVFNEYDSNANKVNFRILIGPNGRNKGLGSEAIKLFIEYGFKNLNLHKIELQVYSFNPRGEHVYTKCGFVKEGVLRQDFKYEKEYIDTILYSILSSEYNG